MADYRHERGLVGNWKGYQIYILEKSEYMDNQYNLKDDVVYVIADDGMRMVNKGYTIGYLSKSGSVSECDKIRYKPVAQKKEKKEEAPVVTSTSGEEVEIELTTEIPEGYFANFAGEVTEFFKHLYDPIIVE